MCKIFEPPDRFKAGFEGPHGIDISHNAVPLVIEMSEYTQTPETECGNIVYRFNVYDDSGSNLGDVNGNISNVGNVLSLDRSNVET